MWCLPALPAQQHELSHSRFPPHQCLRAKIVLSYPHFSAPWTRAWGSQQAGVALACSQMTGGCMERKESDPARFALCIPSTVIIRMEWPQ